MNGSSDNTKGPGRSARAAWIAIGLTWVVLAILVAWGATELRVQMRRQIESRDGQILLAMARVQEEGGESAGGLEPEKEPEPDSELERGLGLDEDPLAVFMHIARREGIVACWLFDSEGSLVMSLPAAAQDPAVPEEARGLLNAGQPFSRFVPALRLSEVFMTTNLPGGAWESATLPVVESYVPLRGAKPGSSGGFAGFLIEARSLADQFRTLDRQLLARALTALGFAMGITGVALGRAFRQLARARRLLERRTEDLLRANQELSRSARIAALGAVTAHLVHGLKNPVSGLQTFVASRGGEGGELDDDWREAKAATRRIQALIHDVVQVIREQETELRYEVPLREVGEAVAARARPSGERRGVRILLEGAPGRNLDNRTSGLLTLMLGNLVENAIEATPEGGTVKLHLLDEPDATVCEVVDEGPGIGVEAQARLFQPQPSTKEGGSGLGLAITRQLALALGGDVRLLASDRHGSTFRVELPSAVSMAEGGVGLGADSPLTTGASRETVGRPSS